MKIYAFHLLNDYSGSPKVLSQLVDIWVDQKYEVHLVTAKGREGFLSNHKGVQEHFFRYRFAKNPIIRLFKLVLSQIMILLKFSFIIKKEDTVYVNTVLPFGAAILGKIKGCRVIYHIHETSMKPLVLKRFLFGIASWTASEIVYVSKYLSKQEALNKKSHVIYNCLENKFVEIAIKNRKRAIQPSNILMVCSLKDYKGVREFLQLAIDNDRYTFRLIVNASRKEIDQYFINTSLPVNLEIFTTQVNLHPHYHWAHLIVNLSNPSTWIETFGLTILEGMAYGLPAIVPPIGGITELIEDGKNGLLIDARERQLLNEKLSLIFNNATIYQSMCSAAIDHFSKFDETRFQNESCAILKQDTNGIHFQKMEIS